MSDNTGVSTSNIFLRDVTSPGRGPVREGVIPHQGPLHPQLVSEAARLSTFQDWPPGLRQKKEEMAAAGLFYVGQSDQVKCFYCDGGLREWQVEDKPWVEHAGWFHNCGFIRLKKSEEFIQECMVTVQSNLVILLSQQSTQLSIKCYLSKEQRRSQKESSQTEPTRGGERPEWVSTLEPAGPEFEEKLRTENEAMKKQMQCKVCFNSEVGVVFLPCGHLVVCNNCAPSLQSCVICRRKITETIKIYMS